MKKVIYQFIFLSVVLSVIASGCSSGNRISGGSSKKCGCGVNKGFVGY
ncbi:MAG TPA: hypothetical protein VKA49_14495 [Flavitalea sp.]|nr:hypothetical protein [Flavitalea sp.]